MSSNEYMRQYMKTRYRNRMNEAHAILGGSCAGCGATTNLQIDHINPPDKSFTLSSIWSGSKAKFLKELEKCQLLCAPCHLTKSIKERSVEHGGGKTGKRNCYCDLCAPLKRRYMKARRERASRVD